MIKNSFIYQRYYMSRPSNSQIDKAGKLLIINNQDKEALDIVNHWRVLHDAPARRIQRAVSNIIKDLILDTDEDNIIITRRLKRMPTIISKITDRKTNIKKLSTMQDIGGVRIVVDSIHDMYRVYGALKEQAIGALIRKKDYIKIREKDYIKNPQDTGYRGIHLIYKLNYPSEKHKHLDGLQVELQIRSRKQHLWATTVEAISYAQGESYKTGQGTENWLNFFALVSSLFAWEEIGKIPEIHQHLQDWEIISLLKQNQDYITCRQILNNLSLHQLAVESNVPESKKKDGYILIISDRSAKRTETKFFKKNNLYEAEQEYMTIEEAIRQGNLSKIAVLIVLDNYTLIQRAYPSMFVNILDFRAELDKALAQFPL